MKRRRQSNFPNLVRIDLWQEDTSRQRRIADTPQETSREICDKLTPRSAARAASVAFLPAALVGLGPEQDEYLAKLLCDEEV